MPAHTHTHLNSDLCWFEVSIFTSPVGAEPPVRWFPSARCFLFLRYEENPWWYNGGFKHQQSSRNETYFWGWGKGGIFPQQQWWYCTYGFYVSIVNIVFMGLSSNKHDWGAPHRSWISKTVAKCWTMVDISMIGNWFHGYNPVADSEFTVSSRA